MSVDMETETGSETRSVLGPGGNRVRVSESEKTKAKKVNVTEKKTQSQAQVKPVKNPAHRSPELVKTVSVNSCSSSDSTSTSTASSVKVKDIKKTLNKPKPVKKIAPEAKQSVTQSPLVLKRCDWITPNSDPLYASFHDEEWGVPVHEDNKLFELLILSVALAELSWPSILNQRGLFRKHFDDFDIASVAKFTEKKLLTLKAHGNFLLSEPKLRAVVENAKQILKVQLEFGSFNNYCWGFVNRKPIKNCYRYGRHVPAKTPKAEVISKDLMRKGFRCVGPTVVYSFMQAAGLVNDHLVTCFRYQECDSNVIRNTERKIQEAELAEAMEKTCLVPV